MCAKFITEKFSIDRQKKRDYIHILMTLLFYVVDVIVLLLVVATAAAATTTTTSTYFTLFNYDF